MTLREFRLDLHVHTCLSPCADPEMRPGAIIDQARQCQLNGIAICDHNSAENVSAVQMIGRQEGVHVFGGMEMTSSEEVHILGIFEDRRRLMEMQNTIHAHLHGENDETAFGIQAIVNAQGEEIGRSRRLLIGATDLPLQVIVGMIHDLSGVAIAAHIDREAFGIIGQLGFLPRELPLDALELSARCGPEKMQEFKDLGLPLISSSDAHYPGDIGKTSTPFRMAELSFPEFRLALRKEDGRTVGL